MWNASRSDDSRSGGYVVLVAIALAAVLALLGCRSEKIEQPLVIAPNTVFPLTEGNVWVFRNRDDPEWGIIIRVTGHESVHGIEYAKVEELFTRRGRRRNHFASYLRYSPEGKIMGLVRPVDPRELSEYTLEQIKKEELTLIDVTAQPGTQWRTRENPNGQERPRRECIARYDSLRIGGVLFGPCKTYRMNIGLDEQRTETYAEGIGPIEFRMGGLYELSGYLLNDRPSDR